MKVILAKKAGFCMGVRRAVETVLDTLRRDSGEIATFGPLIHNPQVLELLSRRGVKVLKTIPERPSGTIIIRAHGVPPAQKARLQSQDAQVVDATCPRVIKVQAIIKKYKGQGYATVIIGDKNHAEVEGLMGYAEPDGIVVSNEADVVALALSGPYIIVSQTTQDEAGFNRLTGLITERFPGGKVFNTICDSTHKRQEEVQRLCDRVQAIVVVGGRNSANTKRLGEIAASKGRPVFLVETEEELDFEALGKFDTVGVTAGASTPTWLINQVVTSLQAVRGRGEGATRQIGYRLLRLLLETNLYISIGGGGLATVCALLQGIKPDWRHFLVAFGYLFAVHNFNRFASQESEKFNDPIRARFYRRYRVPLLGASVVSLASVLTVVYASGPLPFFVILGISILGTLYSVNLIPKSLRPVIRIRGLKEIPGSKTFFVAAAWGIVVAIFPAWESDLGATPPAFGAFLFALLLVYIRSALFDVFELQGDRIVGKETLPVWIGERKTMVLLHWLLAGLFLMLLLLPAAGLMSPLGLWLAPAVLYLVGLALLYERGSLIQGPKLEFAVESVFFLVTLLALAGAR